MRYQRPEVVDFGSIANHTFIVCNPGAPDPIPPKGPESVTTHIDKHLECSENDLS